MGSKAHFELEFQGSPIEATTSRSMSTIHLSIDCHVYRLPKNVMLARWESYVAENGTLIRISFGMAIAFE
jgi:hypothetical protein